MVGKVHELEWNVLVCFWTVVSYLSLKRHFLLICVFVIDEQQATLDTDDSLSRGTKLTTIYDDTFKH